MNALVSVFSKNSLNGRDVPLYIISSGIFSDVIGIVIGFVAGSITCHGIKVGVFEAGAKPSFIAAIGSG
jgi:uncharacterized membrane protein YvlD (DUF360 family)